MTELDMMHLANTYSRWSEASSSSKQCGLHFFKIWNIHNMTAWEKFSLVAKKLEESFMSDEQSLCSSLGLSSG